MVFFIISDFPGIAGGLRPVPHDPAGRLYTMHDKQYSASGLPPAPCTLPCTFHTGSTCIQHVQ